MTLLLSSKSLSKSFGVRPLFRDISIALDDAEHTGLIGPNGSGKSTLLKIFAGLETADTGTIETRRQLRLGYLPQEDRFPAGPTARDVLIAAQHDSHADEHSSPREARRPAPRRRPSWFRFRVRAMPVSGTHHPARRPCVWRP